MYLAFFSLIFALFLLFRFFCTRAFRISGGPFRYFTGAFRISARPFRVLLVRSALFTRPFRRNGRARLYGRFAPKAGSGRTILL